MDGTQAREAVEKLEALFVLTGGGVVNLQTGNDALGEWPLPDAPRVEYLTGDVLEVPAGAFPRKKVRAYLWEHRHMVQEHPDAVVFCLGRDSSLAVGLGVLVPAADSEDEDG